jgi:hypothetical protein
MATATRDGEDLFRQAICAWESAVDSGVKMQEECAHWLRQMCCDTNALSEWYNRGQAVAGKTISKAQENIDEVVRVMNQNVESGVRLIQKALEARQAETASNVRQRIGDWWQTALEAMRTNTQSVFQANSRMLSIWSELARQVNSETADSMTKLARRTAEQAEQMSKNTNDFMKERVDEAVAT